MATFVVPSVLGRGSLPSILRPSSKADFHTKTSGQRVKSSITDHNVFGCSSSMHSKRAWGVSLQTVHRHVHGPSRLQEVSEERIREATIVEDVANVASTKQRMLRCQGWSFVLNGERVQRDHSSHKLE